MQSTVEFYGKQKLIFSFSSICICICVKNKFCFLRSAAWSNKLILGAQGSLEVTMEDVWISNKFFLRGVGVVICSSSLQHLTWGTIKEIHKNSVFHF